MCPGPSHLHVDRSTASLLRSLESLADHIAPGATAAVTDATGADCYVGGVRAGIAIAAVILLGAALYFATLQASQVTCEVCVDFEGRSLCRTGSGADRDTAIYGGRMAACAVLSSGVTAGMQCDRAPARVRCEP